MKNSTKWLTIVLSILLPTLSSATLRPFTNVDCAALAMPKTVLLVHASWCSHCKAFLPVYEQVSNKEKYRDWIFYQMVNDKFENVCGTAIRGVPVTFKNNMKNNLMGNRPQSVLEEFLDSNA
ncbi:thioredoxin family protein [Legionella maioricensis]|uniref:Thioredoxin family protein n=1 Tax=Legionella maioricensis TaxID=2896528 RepID=A0A9X2CXJ2_9GAMM|nr:thioredoxin family protein [Legionella maioricensis]MCL9682645.1 thioredoxin family protein [Legionella maioricensis]MCL9687308.1 thioredoxin family protein [Legionella maioricensis]